jgi:hypothetical protein
LVGVRVPGRVGGRGRVGFRVGGRGRVGFRGRVGVRVRVRCLALAPGQGLGDFLPTHLSQLVDP